MVVGATAEYIGKPAAGVRIGTIAANDFFLCLSIPQEYTDEEFSGKIADIKNALAPDQMTSLTAFESAITQMLVKCNLPAHVSLAAGKLNQDILYIKTIGSGQIYYRRGQALQLLIDGDKSASGQVREFDCVLFTTDTISRLIGTAEDIKVFVDMLSPQDIVGKIQAEQYTEEEAGFGLIVGEFNSTGASRVMPPPSASIPVVPSSVHSTPEMSVMPPIEKKTVLRIPRMSFSSAALNRRRIAMLILACVLLAILVWSVVFGYQRRKAAQIKERVETVTQLVETRINEAKDEAYLDIDQALALLGEAKKEVMTLKEQSEGMQVDVIKSLEKRIAETEAEITKKEDKNADELYDLSLEQKSAQAVALSYDDGSVALLDPKGKTIYVLDLEKKALTKYSAPEVAGASLVALYEGSIYFYSSQKGVFFFTAENKVASLISPDKDWGNVSAIQMYNANLYLLDSSKKMIYKYAGTGSAFGEKSEYIQSGSEITNSALSMAIDSSIYVAGGTSVDKFTRGVSDTFKLQSPSGGNNDFNQLYTDADIDKVITCNATKGICSVFDKKGQYVKQIESSVIRSNRGIFIADEQLHVLLGSKLYTIVLD